MTHSRGERDALVKFLRELKLVFAGDALPHWQSSMETTGFRGWWLDRLDNRIAALTAQPSAGEPVAQGDGWISVADRLPETFLYDDTQCFIGGMKVDPLYRSKSALVALGSHGVGVDVIERIGDSKPFWSSFGKRVTHWMEMPPIPAAPMTAASGMDERDA